MTIGSKPTNRAVIPPGHWFPFFPGNISGPDATSGGIYRSNASIHHIMKNKLILTTTLLATSLAMLTLAACSKSKRDDLADKSKEAYQDTKAAVKEIAHDTKVAVVKSWDDLKGYTFEKRSNFATKLKAHQADFEAGVSKLRAEYSEATASTSRKAAMSELNDSEADYQEKLAAVGNATADTWDAARDNVIASWDRLQASYAKARAN
jgi:hypothetical protein